MSCEVAEDLSEQIFEVTCTHNSIPACITRHNSAPVCGPCSPRPALLYSLLVAGAALRQLHATFREITLSFGFVYKEFLKSKSVERTKMKN